MQFSKALRKGAQAFFVQLRSKTLEEELADTKEWPLQTEEKMTGIPTQMVELLDEFVDVFPDELPNGLPPDRGTEHTIPLEPGAKPIFSTDVSVTSS